MRVVLDTAADPEPAPDPELAWSGTVGVVGAPARPGLRGRAARRPPRLCRAQRADRGRGRDGGRGDDVAARARPPGARHEPDAGIWELAPDARTHSRLICLRRRPAGGGGASELERAAGWLALADTVVADTSAHALHPSGPWQRSRGDARLDAALLLPAIRGAIPAADPRSVATLEAVARELVVDGYCYRYRRLLTEEFDVQQRQLRGNLPLAFVRALLLKCAITEGRGT
jgi:hypothetical protein